MAYLKHYGTPRHSGRYPWGSGKDDEQRNTSLRGYIKELKEQGLTEQEIAKGLNMSTTKLRAQISLEKDAQRKADSAMALRLKDKGYSNVEIGKRMGVNESSIRNLLNPAMNNRAAVTEATVNMLKKQIDEKKYLDVGAGVESHLGVSRTKLNTAIAELEMQGYKLAYVKVEQLGTGKKTSIKVLRKKVEGEDEDESIAKKEYAYLAKNKDQIKTITDWSDDGGRSFLGLEPVKSVSSKRLQVRFAEEGGTDMDGVIQLRRGVEDLSLGKSKYAQVRIAVDGSHYLKGMAIYADDLPDGCDMMFNTNKSASVGKMGALKKMKENINNPGVPDQDNPFGATVRQKHYTDSQGKDQLSPINIVNEEGEWGNWSKSLSSQMLSKQSASLAKKQLELALQIKKEEFDELNNLTNPTVKKKLLESFADDCDSSAVHLKAAAMPRQGSFVILPIPDLKENEIYAPKYKNGETLVLIRYPHGGTFEIPQLTVNNKSAKARAIMENADDAVGIHPKVAGKLSGADFDGDTVLAIPNGKKEIKVSPSLTSLQNFSPSDAYPGYEGMAVIKPKNKQAEMGKVSNLITDMTIKGATTDEIARAVRHSMVVIDSEKHKLNYKQSYIDNNIADLKVKYQGGANKGASTLISRASSAYRIDQVKEAYRADPATGKKIFIPTGETYIDAKGRVVKKQTVTTRMYATEDAHTLSSGTRIEQIYADYANSLKALGNKGRKTALETPSIKSSPSAKETYADAVASLNAQLVIANRNKPQERQAQLLANKVLAAKKAANPDLEASDIKKIKGQALAEARLRTGAKKEPVVITPREWEAIQAGAISNNILSQILNNTDLDVIKQYATPRTKTGMSTAQLSRARQLLSAGYTQAEIASSLGISTSTLSNALKGAD